MKTLKEWTKTASKEAIIHQLLELNDTFNSFDKYLRKELGEETYNDIVKNWCADRASEDDYCSKGVSADNGKERTV